MNNELENITSTIQFKVLGSRGSMPVEGKDFAIFGGSTSCYRVLAGDEEIYLDAGSGIFNAKPEPNSHITILMTHMHLDHIIGLPFFIALGESNRSVNIYAQKRSGLMPQEAIDKLISPPFWPVKIGGYPANVKFSVLPDNIEEQSHLSLGEVDVDMMSGIHPGGSTIYRISYKNKSLVYATDFEHSSAEACDDLANFAKGCDLLLYDAQYKEEEYHKYRGYGHSTPQAGIKIAEKANASKLLLIHHAPSRTDKEIFDMEREISVKYKNVTFAKIDEEILL